MYIYIYCDCQSFATPCQGLSSLCSKRPLHQYASQAQESGFRAGGTLAVLEAIRTDRCQCGIVAGPVPIVSIGGQ